MSTPTIDALHEAEARFDIPVVLRLHCAENRIVCAKIRCVSPSRFEVECSERLDKGQRLTLEHEGHRIEVGVVSASQNSANADHSYIVQEIAEASGEVRAELRLPTNLPASLQIAGRTEPIAARVVDMSPSGMGIQTPEALAPGTKVCVYLEQGLAFGEIRFCKQKSPALYVAGFLLEEYLCPEPA